MLCIVLLLKSRRVKRNHLPIRCLRLEGVDALGEVDRLLLLAHSADGFLVLGERLADGSGLGRTEAKRGREREGIGWFKVKSATRSI